MTTRSLSGSELRRVVRFHRWKGPTTAVAQPDNSTVSVYSPAETSSSRAEPVFPRSPDLIRDRGFSPTRETMQRNQRARKGAAAHVPYRHENRDAR